MKLSQVFYEPHQNIDNLYEAAEKIVKQLYKSDLDGKNYQTVANESIADWRYRLYKKSVLTSKKAFHLSTIPPTKSALLQHVKRVYFQVQSWLGNTAIQPEQWGWKRTNLILVPIMMDEGTTVIPEELMN